MNNSKLLEIIKKRGHTVGEVAQALNIDRSTFYRKINGDVRCGLSIREANTIKDFLGLSSSEADSIFFTNTVA